MCLSASLTDRSSPLHSCCLHKGFHYLPPSYWLLFLRCPSLQTLHSPPSTLPHKSHYITPLPKMPTAYKIMPKLFTSLQVLFSYTYLNFYPRHVELSAELWRCQVASHLHDFAHAVPSISENLSPSDHLPNTTPKGRLQNGTLLYNLTTCPETSKNNSTWSKPLSDCHYIVLVHN